MPRILVATAWLAVVLACQPEQASDPGLSLLEGVEVNEVGAAADAPVLPWRVSDSPQVRIGGVDQDEHQQFVEISAATVLRDGRIVIADSRAGLVAVYGQDGEFREQLGSRGEGPGEFRSPSSLLAVDGDSILIWDRTLWRTTVISPQGDFVRSERYDPTAADLYPVQGMWPETLRLGGAGSRLIRLIFKSDSKSSRGDDLDLAGLAVHWNGTSKVELIQVFPREEQVEVEAPWGPTTLTAPLAAGPRMAVDRKGDRACVGHQARPELLCVSAAGHRYGLRWTSEPRSMWSGDPALARWKDETVEAYSGKISEKDALDMISAVSPPRFYPAFRGLLFDTAGYLWVGLGPSSDGATEYEYLVFGPELSLAGRLWLPAMTVLEIGVDYVLGIRRDILGVEEVVVSRLSRAVGRESD